MMNKQTVNIKKKIILVMVCFCLIALGIMFAACEQGDDGISLGDYTSDEPCVWCGATPTKQIASDTNPEYEAQYYCEECSTTCALDSNPAVDHFTNLYGVETFVCEEHLDY